MLTRCEMPDLPLAQRSGGAARLFTGARENPVERHGATRAAHLARPSGPGTPYPARGGTGLVAGAGAGIHRNRQLRGRGD